MKDRFGTSDQFEFRAITFETRLTAGKKAEISE